MNVSSGDTHEGSTAKRIVRSAIKVVAAIAGLVFVITPTHEFHQLLFFLGSLVVLLVCLLIWLLLFGNEDTGYWPNKPE